MSDFTHRRGTDYDSLRNLGVGADRSPREAEDPLAELARLVSQGADPYAESEAPPVSAPSRAYAPPVADRGQDRLDPIAPSAPRQASFDPRAYGSTSQPDYDPDDFFAEPVASSNQGYGATYRDDFGDDGFGAGPQAAYHDGYDDPDAYPVYDDGLAAADMPVRSRRGLMLATVAGVVVLGGVAAWATGMFGGSSDVAGNGTPPIIKAESEPVKVVAEAKPVVQQKQSYDRIPVNGEATVVSSAEEPGEKPAPRVILPGASSAPTESRIAETADSSDDAGNAADPNAGRRVKTFAVRPDGSMAANTAESGMASNQPPAPIEGTGVAQGMSMQPGNEFGIMTSEAPVQGSTGRAVPMPEPRPSGMAQAYAPEPAAPAPLATNPQPRAPAPQRANGGPPSSPQPQVEITNRRPLRGTPGPSSQATPPAQTAPRQVASAAPVALSSQAAPRAAAPQVAALSSSGRGGFGVQLTAQRSEAEAVAAFNALKQRYPNVLGSYSPVIARADLGADRGVFYRAMVPASSQTDASNLCIQFKASGVDCIVQRR